MKENSQCQLSTQEAETDLHLLLECLNCQIFDAVSVKQSLLAIGTLCANTPDTKDVLRKSGGLSFILKLARTTQESDVREAALYTLGCAVENNPYSQTALATNVVFKFLSEILKNQHTSARQLQTACFLFLSLVTNNSHGQMLARTSECLEALFNIFKTRLPRPEAAAAGQDKEDESWFEEIDGQSLGVWAAATNAISGCLNNPQNDDNQRLCAAIFPRSFVYLQDYVVPAVVRPITSLLGLAVANNFHNQLRVQQAGGIKVLMSALHRCVNRLQQPAHRDMATAISSTLDTLVSDNVDLCAECGKLGMVSLLHHLLTSCAFPTQSLMRFIITLGHLVENSAENRQQFMEIGGMGCLVSLLAQSHDPELVNAAKYVLHNCVNAESPQQDPTRVAVGAHNIGQMKPNEEAQQKQQKQEPAHSKPEPAQTTAANVEQIIDEKFKALEKRISDEFKESGKRMFAPLPPPAERVDDSYVSSDMSLTIPYCGGSINALNSDCPLPQSTLHWTNPPQSQTQRRMSLPVDYDTQQCHSNSRMLNRSLPVTQDAPVSHFSHSQSVSVPPQYEFIPPVPPQRSGLGPAIQPVTQICSDKYINSQSSTHQTNSRTPFSAPGNIDVKGGRQNCVENRFLKENREKLSKQFTPYVPLAMAMEEEGVTSRQVQSVPSHSNQAKRTSQLESQLEKEKKLRRVVEVKARDLEKALKQKENAEALTEELKRQSKQQTKLSSRRRRVRHAKSRVMENQTSNIDAESSSSELSISDIGSPKSTSTPNTSFHSSRSCAEKLRNKACVQSCPRDSSDSPAQMEVNKVKRKNKEKTESNKKRSEDREKKSRNNRDGLEDETSPLPKPESKVHCSTVGLQTDLSSEDERDAEMTDSACGGIGDKGGGSRNKSPGSVRCMSVGVQTPSCLGVPLSHLTAMVAERQNKNKTEQTEGAVSRRSSSNPPPTSEDLEHSDGHYHKIELPPDVATPLHQETTFLKPQTPVPRVCTSTSQDGPFTPRRRLLLNLASPRFSVKKVQPNFNRSRILCCTPVKKSQLRKPLPSHGLTACPPSPCQSEFDFQLLRAAKPANAAYRQSAHPSTPPLTQLPEAACTELQTPVCMWEREEPPKISHSSSASLKRMVLQYDREQMQSTASEGEEGKGDGHNSDSEKGEDVSCRPMSAGGDSKSRVAAGEDTNEQSRRCPGCNAPAAINGPLLNSRNFNIVIETHPYTCTWHRLIRKKERDVASRLKAPKGRKGRPLEGLLDNTSSEAKPAVSDPYDIDTLTDSEDESVPPTPSYPPAPSPGKHLLLHTERRPRVPYTHQELANLQHGVERLGKFWNQILVTYEFHPSRTAVDLMEKYKRLKNPQSTSPRSRRPFSMAEERRLRRGVRLYGYNWKVIHKAFRFPHSRRPQDLKDKWHNMHKNT